MARQRKTADEVEAVVALLDRVTGDLRHVISTMKAANLPNVFIHWSSPAMHYAPRLAEWAAQIRGEMEGQVVAFNLGIASAAERSVMSGRAQKARKEAAKKAAAESKTPRRPKE